MSTQTRQTFKNDTQNKINHFQPQTQSSHHYIAEELYNNDNEDRLDNYESDLEEGDECENSENTDSFLELSDIIIQEKS